MANPDESSDHASIQHTLLFGDDNRFVGDVIALGNINSTIVVNHDPYDVRELQAYNPYLGLKAFRYADRHLYAGRDDELQQAVAFLTTPGTATSVLFITGISGSGKSSFVQAGLLPHLTQHYAHKRLLGWSMRPSRYPVAQFRDALERFGITPPDPLTPTTWNTALQTTPSDQMNVLIIDQFEELFTQIDQPADRTFVFDLLLAMPAVAVGRTHVILTMRADYLPDLLHASTPLYHQAVRGIVLGHMTESALQDAIYQPLRWFKSHYPMIKHKTFEPELLAHVIRDVSAFHDADADTRAGYLPLLQVTLEDLWDRGSLRHGAYHSLTHALQQRAHTVYVSTRDAHGHRVDRSPEHQAMMMDLLLALVNPSLDSSNRRDVRHRRTIHELCPTPHHRALLEELMQARLVSGSLEVRNQTMVQVVDLIHESLIINWGDLAQAIEEKRTALHRRKRFEDALNEWMNHGCTEAYLLSKVRLAEAETLRDHDDIATRNADAQTFIRQSRAVYDADQQARLEAAEQAARAERQRAESHIRLTQRTRRFAVLILILLLVALGAAGLAFKQQQRAVLEANTRATSEAGLAVQLDISESRRLATLARDQLAEDPELALLLASEAAIRHDNNESSTVLRDALKRMPFALQWCTSENDIQQAVFNADSSQMLVIRAFGDIVEIRDHTGTTRTTIKETAVRDALWGPDGQMLLMKRSSMHLYDVHGRPYATLTTDTGDFARALVSPKGTHIAAVISTALTSTAVLWDVQSQPPQVVATYDSTQSIAFNADGTELMTTTTDGDVVVWDQRGEKVYSIDAPLIHFQDAYFTADTQLILVRSSQGRFWVWEKTGGVMREILPPHDIKSEGVFSLSPDSTRLLIEGGNANSLVLDSLGNFLGSLPSFDSSSSLKAVSLSPDGRFILVAASSSLCVWDARPTLPQVLHTNHLEHVAFQPHGSGMLIIDPSHQVSIGSTTTGTLTPILGLSAVQDVQYSSDGSRFLTRSSDSGVQPIRGFSFGLHLGYYWQPFLSKHPVQ